MSQAARALLMALFISITIGMASYGAAYADEFGVQVAAFRQADRAEILIAELRQKGLNAFSRLEQAGQKGMWHRVYIGPFASRAEAKQQAETLTAQGVITDYRVRNLGPGTVQAKIPSESAGTSRPAVAVAATTQEPGPGTPDGWEIIVDLSGSINDQFHCGGYFKHEAVFSILNQMNKKIPALQYQAALRKFGYKNALTRSDYTALEWGVDTYDRQAFGIAVSQLIPSRAISPLGWAMKGAEAELESMPGRKALIILSDFKENRDFGDPLERAKDLAARFGNDLCIFTINVGQEKKEIKLAQEIAAQSGCGKTYDGCRLLSDEAYFDQMVSEIFGVARIVTAAVCPDADGDNICDDRDRCPNTPKGAPVDDRGCWIAAYSQFFDFDKAVVKKDFLPRIKLAADILQANPHVTISVTGHTDAKGAEAYNFKLGLRRAEAVRDKLVEYGVDPKRLRVESFGETSPIADNKTEEGRAKNRRVEINVWEPERGKSGG
jgi:OOP family OmpA-OmpF porin